MPLDSSAETTCQLPFFAPQSWLPAPLPTAEQIETSSELIKEYTGRRIVRFGDYIIKYGLNVSLIEGENMLLIRKILPAHVPEVYALYSKNEASGIVHYIVMERIPGDTLDSVWDGIDSVKKTEIATKLRLCLDKIRRLPSPDYFGSIGRRQFEDCMFWTAPDDISSTAISGPFESESLLNTALIEKYIYNSGLNYKAAFYRRVLPSILRDHKPAFTHGDLQRKNIIIRENGEVVLLDWETAGWYPEYWEYAIAVFACGAWQDDWHEFIGQVLVEYPTEYAWFDMLRRECWS